VQSSNDIRVGDTVYVRGEAGENMSVLRIENGEAYCVWFEGSELRNAVFPLEQLEHALDRGSRDSA
jgi:uncharacterized protein YodC (DUF2158 family)